MSQADSRLLKRKAAAVRGHVRRYVLGCIGLLLMAIVFIMLGVMRVTGALHSTGVILLACGGILLIIDMLTAWDYNASLPKDFVPVSAFDFPALFKVLREVMSDLGLAPINYLYLCPQAFAAVFIRPSVKNLFSHRPALDLAMGMGFLTQLTDKQLKTILYHEFGHYCQESIRETGSVYRFGQYARMVLADRKDYSSSILSNQTKAPSALFYMHTLKFATRISHEFKELSELMEYEADDVAERYMGGLILKETIRKASSVRNTYDAILWGLAQLPDNSFIDDEYSALRIVSEKADMLGGLTASCRRRVARLPDTVSDGGPDSWEIRQEACSYQARRDSARKGPSYPAADFAGWLVQGLPIYKREAHLRKSVVLHIHMDPAMHKLPLGEGTYQILLDDWNVGIGNYRKGYDIRVRTAPGRHTVCAYSPSGVKFVPFDFTVEEGGTYQVEMDYEWHLWRGQSEVFACGIEKITS